MSGRVVVFGDVIDDIVVVPSGPIRADTDTPSSIRHRAGGSAANVASWLGDQGAAVDFVGRVATEDVTRHDVILSGFGVTPHLVADDENPTGAIVVLVDGNQRSMLTERGANAFLTADAVTDALLDAAAIVHFTGYSIYHSQDHAPLRRLFERAASRNVVVSVDPASAGDLDDFGVDRFLDLIDGAGMLFPNLDEGKALTGLDDPYRIAEVLGERFPLVALTLGVGGVVIAERGKDLVFVPAVESAVVDPTGAGDSFTAGFLAAWMSGAGAEAAASAAVAVAARAVTSVGGRPSPARA
ncbi:sugar/nucleoside kinase (ribokinase family) [Cryobacterium mesophilum]|uniref:carbohydrate kinase family protein n=1 Tax=Terrimesophilobacter mesophilus TaxID=433647 RepID=UPI001425841A|nr:PfkB family carbohydrate kinase [Terrimesophilobacter mesophilus]MBB5633366.1 sugar/nucleoside kinase (ribokinase family) [Terrimesophilobacter mesophilus]